MDMPQDQSPMGQAPAMGAEQAPQGYEICIKVGPNNELSVGVEGMAAEASEGAEPAETTYQPAKDIKTALTLALSAFKNDGQMPDMESQNKAFDEGFGGPQAGGDMGQMRGGM